MIVFCEECGKSHDIDDEHGDTPHSLMTCDGCDETLSVSRQTTSIGRPSQTPIRLMIVDDSSLIRRAVRQMFTGKDRFLVVGEAANGREALDRLPTLKPDVITLDINMPEMDGLTTLKHIMIKRPTPTVMISALTREGATETFDALRFGAIDFIPKPSQRDGVRLDDQERLIRHKVKLAANIKMGNVRLLRAKSTNGATRAGEIKRVVVLGASEGGYGALLKIIPQLSPAWPAAYLGVIYDNNDHINAFIDYLNRHAPLRIKRATDGAVLHGGTCYLSSGAEYVTATNDNGRITLCVHPSPFPDRRGAINMLMLSLSEVTAARTVAVVLSGKDEDGAEGVAEIARVGGEVMIQEPRTCLFKEMSRAALQQCQSAHRLNDSEIAPTIKTLFDNQHL